ncbi:probable DNA polymerase [Belonocnema kinseyi]|uniref:probable DNA polymerase n=1 Tax=Belonocnema kinseyi TaxID=2817044 RepID=UPI00143D667E|nr:probable DNA polymerase [Belonocnema kinseyi]
MDDPDPNVRCKWWGIRQYIFSEDPVSEFTKFTTRKMSHFTETVCIAHNAKGFEAQFIFSHLIEEKGLRNPPEIILNGTSIHLIKVNQTRFIDSLNYLHMPLRQLPEAFGLEEAKKRTFPHLFNTPENQEYTGKIPDAKYFSPDTMSRKARESFYKWYEECVTSEYNFNFKEELRSYCINDVDILRRSCLAFRALFLEVANVDPFIESITIASACSKVFRKNDLKADQISIIPHGGYRRADRHSKNAIELLLALERDLDIEMTHSCRAREFRLPEGCLVDGYFGNKEVSTKVVYQFHGCY